MLYILSLLILTITSKGKQPRLRGVKLLTKSADGAASTFSVLPESASSPARHGALLSMAEI